MKMNKLIRLIVLAFALSMPISIWGQCASIYQKGETYMKRGRYRDAIKSFKAAMKIYLNATELKQQVEAILDSAYHVFKEKANIMKDLDQAVAAQAFEDRAKKIEPYINIDNNENE